MVDELEDNDNDDDTLRKGHPTNVNNLALRTCVGARGSWHMDKISHTCKVVLQMQILWVNNTMKHTGSEKRMGFHTHVLQQFLFIFFLITSRCSLESPLLPTTSYMIWMQHWTRCASPQATSAESRRSLSRSCALSPRMFATVSHRVFDSNLRIPLDLNKLEPGLLLGHHCRLLDKLVPTSQL